MGRVPLLWWLAADRKYLARSRRDDPYDPERAAAAARAPLQHHDDLQLLQLREVLIGWSVCPVHLGYERLGPQRRLPGGTAADRREPGAGAQLTVARHHRRGRRQLRVDREWKRLRLGLKRSMEWRESGDDVRQQRSIASHDPGHRCGDTGHGPGDGGQSRARWRNLELPDVHDRVG